MSTTSPHEQPTLAPRLGLPAHPRSAFPDVPTTPNPIVTVSITPPETTPVEVQHSSSMMQRLLSLLPKRIMGFSVVGGSVMVGGITLLFTLVHFLHVEQHLAYLIQAIASIETNFFLNRFLNWKERDGSLFAQWLKFHSTSAVTFPVNQALFAVLTWLGMQYLLVTVIGAGVAAVVNYLANDRFVFHKQDVTKRETVRVPSIQPLVTFPHVGVVIPVRNSERTIRDCLSAVLSQSYPGRLSVFLVGNVPEQDSTWGAIADMVQNSRISCIQIRRPAGWVGRDANMKRYCGCDAAVTAGVDVIALLDSQVVPADTWLVQAVELLHRYHVDGVAGASRRTASDHSLSGLYQDTSLFSEWPHFGDAFFLSLASFGKAKGLPVTNNLFLTRRVWEEIHRRWPLKATYSWEDFRLAWEIASSGYTLYCTDRVLVFRNHRRKFRLIKHIAAGAGAVAFYREQPACLYARRMLVKAGLVTGVALALLALFVSTALLGDMSLLALLSVGAGCALLALGIVNIVRARDGRGVFFPILDILHIGFWIAGAASVTGREDEAEDAQFANALVTYR